MRNEFTAIVEPAEEGGFWAFCAEVPGANGQGETVEETLEDLKAAIELALEVMREDGVLDASEHAQRTVVTVVG
jgi:predicted RNase H-like HicB family nuclease